MATYAYFGDRDPLTRVVLEQMLAGVSTRHVTRTREPVGKQVGARERSTSKSAVSREFVGRTREHLDELMSRELADVRLAALMIDGIELKGRCCIVVRYPDVGITSVMRTRWLCRREGLKLLLVAVIAAGRVGIIRAANLGARHERRPCRSVRCSRFRVAARGNHVD